MKRTFSLLLALMTLTLASSSCSFFRSAGMQSCRHVLPEQRISIEEVYSSRDHLGIYGRLYRPVGVKGRLPLVILSHGFGVTTVEVEGIAEVSHARQEFGIALAITVRHAEAMTEDDQR